MTGIIFDVQRYSIHDGPGVRTLVFMKGCPLSCKWCSNPEGQESRAEIRFLPSRCVGEERCKAPCVKSCPNAAISTSQGGKPTTDRVLCQGCGRCTEACWYGARLLSGRGITSEELVAEVLKDEPFYRSSCGGVTLGGGEPLAQFEFAAEFLERCKESYLHTAIETCGHVPWKHLEAVLNNIDEIYYDIKHMDSVKHKEVTGEPNGLILQNAGRLFSTNKAQIIVRVPIIPGFNDSEKSIKDISRFVAESGGKKMELLPYHRFGISKYSQLDREYELKDVQRPTEKHTQRLRSIVKSLGIKEVTGSM